MCGIVGIAGDKKNSSLKKMLGSVAHRGPDDSGTYINTFVQLGFARLSIIDLSPKGHQPMTNKDASVWIIFNGEIYNYQDLKQDLAKHYHFTSKTDTEVLIHGYEQWGLDGLLKRINGMFAFCLYDKKKGELYLVRDRIGKKPLYYTRTKDYFAFASEVKAFFALKDFSFGIDQEMFDLFMGFPYLPNNEQTMLTNVSKVPPGHYLRINADLETDLISYWHLPKAQQSYDFAQGASKLEKLLIDSVQMRLVADVPVGILLSGGLDSSLITALAVKTSEKINTITISFPESGIDEQEYALAVAKHCNTTHTAIQLKTEHVYDEFTSKIAMYDDLSTTDSGLFSTYLLSKEIRKMGVRVVLVGEGADELFGGYSWFGLSQKPYSFLPQRIRTSLYYYAIMRQLPSKRSAQYVSFLQEKLDETSGSFFKKMQAYEIRYSLPNHYCMKVDKGTMYASIEARAPYMDYRIVEIVRHMHDQYLLRGNFNNPKAIQEKYILREIAKKYLPASIVARKKRGGMLSVAHLLKEGLKKNKKMILDNPFITEFYGEKYITDLINNESSLKVFEWQREWILWKSILFSLWYNHYQHARPS